MRAKTVPLPLLFCLAGACGDMSPESLETTVGALSQWTEIGPISEQQPDGATCPGRGGGINGASCEGSYCHYMRLQCMPLLTANLTAVDTTPDPPSVWSEWISEEKAPKTPYQHLGHTVVGNTIACETSFGAPFPNRKIMDGIRASGNYSDDI